MRIMNPSPKVTAIVDALELAHGLCSLCLWTGNVKDLFQHAEREHGAKGPVARKYDTRLIRYE